MCDCFRVKHLIDILVCSLFIVLFSCCIQGCRTTQVAMPISGIGISCPHVSRQGIYPYHIVSQGETLWRICKNYGVDIKDVMELNHLTDASKIEVGQKIFLPNSIVSSRKEKMKIGYGQYKGTSESGFIKPVKGKLVLSYGKCQDGWVNKGIEIKVSSLDVIAPKSGKIVFLGEDMDRYGQVIIIDHGDGYKSIISGRGRVLVNVGDIVRQGQIIMKLNRVNQRLHFEVRKATKPVNPLKFMHYER